MLLVSLFTLSLFFFGCAKPIDPEKIKANTRELDDKWKAAFAKEDINGVMGCYWNSPEVIFYPPDAMGEKGYEAIKAGYEKFFAENEVKSAELSNVSSMALGDYGLDWGNWSITIGTPDGRETKLEGRFTNVSGMRDGKWVWIHDHASAPLPPPPTPEEMQKMMKEMMKKPMKK